MLTKYQKKLMEFLRAGGSFVAVLPGWIDPRTGHIIRVEAEDALWATGELVVCRSVSAKRKIPTRRVWHKTRAPQEICDPTPAGGDM